MPFNTQNDETNSILFRLYTESRKALEQEQTNINNIHIYSINKSWVSFEKSAYFINVCIPQCDISCIWFDSQSKSDSPILMVDIFEDMLIHLQQKYKTVENRLDYKMLSSNISLEYYLDWRERKINDLSCGEYH